MIMCMIRAGPNHVDFQFIHVNIYIYMYVYSIYICIYIYTYIHIHTAVSISGGTPKSSISRWDFHINHPAMEIPSFMESSIWPMPQGPVEGSTSTDAWPNEKC